MKKVIALLLALCSLTLVACSKKKGNDETVAQSGVGSQTVNTDGDSLFRYIADDLPATMDFGGAEINIAMRDDARYYSELKVDDGATTVVSDAIFVRNKELEARLNVKMNIILCDNDNAGNGGVGHGPWYKVSQAVSSGSDTYDVAMGSSASAMAFALQGQYRNLRNIENLNLSKEYWAQGMIENMTVADTTFFTTGSLSTYLYDSAFVVYFNKNLSEEYDIKSDYVYETVMNGEWTLDKMMELTKNVYSDKNGNNIADDGDIYGFGLQVTSATDGFFSSCDIPCTEIVDNKIVFSVNMHKLSTVVDKLKTFLWSSDATVALAEGPSYVTSSIYYLDQQFANDEIMFVTDWLYSTSTETMRNMQSDFGVLPYPKYDLDQKEYYTYAHDKMTIVGVPLTVSDADSSMIGAFLEVMASGGQNTVMPAYYEKTLTARNIRDPQSVETMNIIVRNISNDRIWQLYSNVNTHLLRNQVWYNYDTLASTYQSKYKEANTKLETVYDSFVSFKNQ